MLTLGHLNGIHGTNDRKLHAPAPPVRVRPIRPSDAPALQAGFDELSDMSRYHRFHSGMKRLPEQLLRYLTNVDGVNHVALVALEADDLEHDHGIGVARFVRNREDPATAELAVTVLDRAQGRGVARRLLAELAAAAELRGVHTFTATVIAGNTRARRLLTGLGAIGRGHASDVMAFHLPVAALTQSIH